MDGCEFLNTLDLEIAVKSEKKIGVAIEFHSLLIQFINELDQKLVGNFCHATHLVSLHATLFLVF